MLAYYEEAACGMVTRATSIRLRKQLTWKGLERYWKGLSEGLTPRQSLHKLIVEGRQRDKEREAKAKSDFILYALPVAKMSLKEFIEANGRDAHKRWEQFRPEELKRLLKNWQAKTLDQAVSNYVNKQLEHVAKGEDFVFRYWHAKLIQEAKEYGFEYNLEAAEYHSKFPLDI